MQTDTNDFWNFSTPFALYSLVQKVQNNVCDSLPKKKIDDYLDL